MDPITKGMMETFLLDYPEVSDRSVSDQFEYFAASLLLRNYAGARMDVDVDSHIQGDGIIGIDFFAVIVNDEIVNDLIELEEILQQKSSIDVEFLFGQIKGSRSRNLGDFSVFLDTVKRIIGEVGRVDKCEYPSAPYVKMVYEQLARFRKNPEVRTFFVHTGGEGLESGWLEKKEQFKQDLLETVVVSAVDVQMLGAHQVQDLYRITSQGLRRTISLPGRKPITGIPEVEEGFIGLIDADELLKLISLDSDSESPYHERKFARSVFSENVRAYQGHVEVNEKMLATLRSDARTQFPVLNNGITIVAQGLRPTGEDVVIDGYQIVNGCQTAHVLHEYFSARSVEDFGAAKREALETRVVVKVVGTDSPKLSRAIAQATNQQTRVSPENLLANLPVQLEIENYFKYQDLAPVTLYYERRDKQWESEQISPGVWRVISIRHMIQAFGSAFLKLPHTANRYYQDLREHAEDNVFREDYAVAYFWVAALMYCRMDFLFRNGKIDSALKPIKFHVIAAIARAYMKGRIVLATSDKVAEKSLRDLVGVVVDDDRYVRAIEECWDVAKAFGPEINRDFARTKKDAVKYIDKATKQVRTKGI